MLYFKRLLFVFQSLKFSFQIFSELKNLVDFAYSFISKRNWGGDLFDILSQIYVWNLAESEIILLNFVFFHWGKVVYQRLFRINLGQLVNKLTLLKGFLTDSDCLYRHLDPTHITYLAGHKFDIRLFKESRQTI